MKDRDIAAAFIAELEASVEYETHDLPNGGTIRVKRTEAGNAILSFVLEAISETKAKD